MGIFLVLLTVKPGSNPTDDRILFSDIRNSTARSILLLPFHRLE